MAFRYSYLWFLLEKTMGKCVVWCCNRGALGHETQDNFLFTYSLINSRLIRILHLTQQRGFESTSSQYHGHLSCWQEQTCECDIGKIITWGGNMVSSIKNTAELLRKAESLVVWTWGEGHKDRQCVAAIFKILHFKVGGCRISIKGFVLE